MTPDAILLINGHQLKIYRNTFGRIFCRYDDGYYSDASPVKASIWQDAKPVTVKSPVSDLYHCWHICMCDRCTTPDPMTGYRTGGHIFDHSQASFSDHMRFVPSDRVFTFSTKEVTP